MCGVCARRGALFLRVRDELRMTLDSLQVAYQSSLAYGVRHALECEQADEAGVAIATFDGQTSKWQHQIGALERLQLYFVRKDGRVFWKGHVGMIAHDGKLTGDGPIVKALEVLRAMPQYDGTESFHLHERLAKAEPKGRQLEGLERDPDTKPRENSIRPGYVDDALKARQQEMKGEL